MRALRILARALHGIQAPSTCTFEQAEQRRTTVIPGVAGGHRLDY